MQSLGTRFSGHGGCWVRVHIRWLLLLQALHAILRYQSLAVLAFDNLNQKRACLLARQHVSGQPMSCEESSCAGHLHAFGGMCMAQHGALHWINCQCVGTMQLWLRAMRKRACWHGRPWRSPPCALAAPYRTYLAVAPAPLQCR